MAEIYKNPGALSDGILEEEEARGRTKNNPYPNAFYVDEKGERFDFTHPRMVRAYDETNKRANLGHVLRGVDKRTPERKAQGDAWVRDLTEKQRAEFNPQKDRTIHFIYGNGGVGKSTFIRENNLQKLNPSFLIDSDEFVEKYIPETSNQADPERAFNTAMVHDESTLLRDQMYKPLLEEGYNFINPTVKPKLDVLRDLKKRGYKIKGTFLDSTRDTALSRGIKRFITDGGRYVPPEAYKADGEIMQAWEDAIKEGLFDEWEEYDANSPDYKKVLRRSSKTK